MKDYLYAGLVGAVAVCLGVFVALFLYSKSVPVTGGDFAGGIIPSTLWTPATSTNSVAPVGAFTVAAPNGLYLGGYTIYNEQTEYNTASGTPASVITLGPMNSVTSTATTTMTVPNTIGLTVGAICSCGAATSTVFVSGCTLLSTDGVTGTASVAYTNFTGANLAVPTATVLRITFDQLPY